MFGGTVRARLDGGDMLLTGSTSLVDNGARADLIVLAATDPRGRRLNCLVEAGAAGVAPGSHSGLTMSWMQSGIVGVSSPAPRRLKSSASRAS